MKFIKHWNGLKQRFIYGVDYVDVDVCNYIAICVATFDVMHELFKSGIFMRHCTVQSQFFLLEQFKKHALSDERGIKAFYFLKDADISEFDESAKTNEIEFCGWIKPKSHEKVLYHFCDSNNVHAHSSNKDIEVFYDRVRFEDDGFHRIVDVLIKPNMAPVREAIELSYFSIINSISIYEDKFYGRIKKELKCEI